MSKAWILAKLPEFARDVMRDFCLAAAALEEQFREFDATGEVRFESLRDLLGDEMNKGLLWRLKDTAHHFFQNDASDHVVGRFLDWSIGYVFHESMKLKEDAYQRNYYAPRFLDLKRRELPDIAQGYCQELTQILGQTRESIEREIRRIRFILRQCRGMIPLYFSLHSGNMLLARFLFEQNPLVRQVFQDGYDALVAGIYGPNSTELMYVLAARSLRQGGWFRDASRAVAEAQRINPGSEVVTAEKALVDQSPSHEDL